MHPFVEKDHRLTDPYVTAGNRVYVIGTQDGSFPDEGSHVPGEMMGVWNHPIKLVDAFYVGFRHEEEIMWPTATSFRAYPFFTEHVYALTDHTLVRRQFVPDDEEALIVTLEYTNLTHQRQETVLLFGVRSDLRPAWLSEARDGADVADQHDGYLLFQDSLEPSCCMVGTDATIYAIQLGTDLPYVTKGNGTNGTITVPIQCEPGQVVTVRFVIAGSTNDVTLCQETLERGLNEADELFQKKAARYRTIDAQTAIEVPSKTIENVIPWVKYNTDWLDRKTSMGRGLGAGLPEYPWWFGCDNSYALEGVLALGWFDLAKDTLRLLADVSARANGNGRIIHEVSTSGVVYNPGNTQETPHFCRTVWEVFRWSGDIDFLRDMYPLVRQALEWTLGQVPDGANFPVGYGIIEVEGLNDQVLDSAVHTSVALDCCAKMARVLGDSLLATLAEDKAQQMKSLVLERFWDDANHLFRDVIASPHTMNPKLEQWASRADTLGLHHARDYYRSLIDNESSDERAYLLKHWIVNTPLEAGIAPLDCALAALDAIRESFDGPHGVYLSGLEQQSMMTISTGVQAMAECTYGRSDEALYYIEKMAASINQRMPGAITEMSPDGGCFVQAWTLYGVVCPIVRYMFGVSPDAFARRCSIDPRMPAAWKEARMVGLCVGDNKLDFSYRRTSEGEFMSIRSEQSFTLQFPSGVRQVNRANEASPDIVREIQAEPGEELIVQWVPQPQFAVVEP